MAGAKTFVARFFHTPVKKKMKDKAFARAVNRDDIIRGAAELGMSLDDVIAEVIKALSADAERLGLAGAQR
jgi:predicted hydrolase (HD superfamily)